MLLAISAMLQFSAPSAHSNRHLCDVNRIGHILV